MKQKKFSIYTTLILGFFLVACKQGGESKAPESVSCGSDFEKTVAKVEVSNSDIYFDVDDLSFLDDEGLVLSSIELRAMVDGKHSTETTEISLALNGSKASRKDGAAHVDRCEANSASNKTDVSFALHKMFLNGGEAFDQYIDKLRKQKGRLKLAMLSKNKYTIRDAQVVFSGKVYRGCSAETSSSEKVHPLTTTIDSTDPAQSPTRLSSITINFSTENKKTGNFWCSLDGSEYEKCRSPQTYSGLGSGAHTFTVYSVHPSGAKEKPSATYKWVIDNVPPSVTITNRAELKTLTNERSVAFEFMANEVGSTVCSIDGAEPEPCTSPKIYSNLSDGAHLFSVNAIDAAGNVGENPETFRWSVDATAPIANFVSIEPASALSNSQTKTFSFGASETSTFECAVDNGAFQPCESPMSLSSLSEGNHWFDVRAIDLAGNSSPTITYAWKIDLTAPVIQLGNVTPSQGATNASTILVEFSTDETATTTCGFDGAEPAGCENSFTVSDLENGRHELVISAVDQAGNASTPVILAWEVDYISPMIQLSMVTPAGSFISSTSLRAEIESSEASELEVTLNGAIIGSRASPVELSGLSDGHYLLHIRAQDRVGNWSNVIEYEFNVDTVAPQLTVTSSDNRILTNIDNRSFTLSADEDVKFECNVDEAGSASCISPLDLSGLADGQHSVEIRAVDLAGNASATQSVIWSIDTVAPTITRIDHTESGSSHIFTVIADEGDVTTECAMDSEAFQACVTPISYDSLEPGQHTFKARVRDLAGNMNSAGTALIFEVASPVQTFITGISPNSAVTNNTSITFAFTASVPNATFACVLDGGNEFACVSPLRLDGLSQGNHSFAVYATDPSGTRDGVGANYNWRVDLTSPTISNLVVTATSTTITMTYTTSEPATHRLRWGLGFTINQSQAETTTYVTTHTLKLTGLSSNTQYSVQGNGRDAAGNPYTTPIRAIRTAR